MRENELRVFWIAIGLFALLAATPAGAVTGNLGEATPGYVYFNRPGATLAAHNSDLTSCANDIAYVWKPLTPSNDPMMGGIVGALVWAGPLRAGVAANVENCMVVRGWRTIQLPEAEGKRLTALPLADFIAQMEPMIGASAPIGTVARVFDNDAARASTVHFSSRPSYFSDGQLSQRLNFDRTAAVTPTRPPFMPFEKLVLDPKWPMKPLRPTDLASAPPGSALLVTRVKGQSMRNGMGVTFERLAADPNQRAFKADNAPDRIVASIGLIYKKSGGNWFIYAVPPGHWRINNSGFTNYCWGAPAFDVKAGDVIYTGTFDLSSEDLDPDLSLEPVKEYLADPSIGNRLKSAVYVNGSLGECGFSSIYALEFKSAPFAPGYAWGSRAGVISK